MNNHEELFHHGIKGQKWGQRRYQNKDGSLTNAGRKRYEKDMSKLKAEKKKLRNEERTQKKIQKLKDLESEVDTMKKRKKENKSDNEKIETPEEKKKRLLSSTDPNEIYKNKDLFTTAELNDRINRIDTEARLKSKIPVDQKKNGIDHINEKMSSITRTINNASNLYKSIDSAYSSVAGSTIGKKLAKELGLESKKKEFNADKLWIDRNKKSTQELMDANKRLLAEESIKKVLDSRAAAEKKARETESTYKNAQKQVNDYFNTWQNREYGTGEYQKSGRDINDSRTYTRSKNPADTPLLEYTEKYTATYKDVYGTGKSKFTGWDKQYNSSSATDGENYVNTLLLEDKRYRK